jgi:integrase
MTARSTPPARRAPDAVLLDLVDELTRAGRFAATTLDTIASTANRFGAFCERHGVDVLPATDTTVLAFLHSQQPSLSWVHAKSQARAITCAHDLAGLPRPRLAEVARYLQALRRDPTAAPRQPKVAAWTGGEVETMVAKLAASSCVLDGDDPVVAGRRAAVALARLGGSSWHEVATTPLHAVTEPHPDDDRSQQLAREAVAVAARHGDRLGDLFDPHGLAHRMVLSGRRAGLRVRHPDNVRDLNEDDFRALVADCDPAHQRNVRDWTYLCVGISGALRHVSLANAAIEDVHPTADGYVATFRHAKLPPGQVLVKEFRHFAEDPGDCSDLLCPACALDRHLDICRRQGRRTGPLLATRYGGQWRAMTRQNGRLRVLQAYEALDLDQRKRIATRSLRSTAATWAFREGMTIAQIAEHVTNHRDPSTCRLYVEGALDLRPPRPVLT